MNSNQKGKRGEREFAHFLQDHGFHARRGQQFSGGDDSPDVVCVPLERYHFEVKRVQALNVSDAMAQALGDCGAKTPIVAHRKNHTPWMVTLKAEDFLALVRLAGAHD